jgi:DNA-binding transcriptional MerR regulator/methylmalonyl-CoA mutase cobalamin-binding subunit
MTDPIHSIKYVAQRTGLTAHTIRAWERRYAALVPVRTETNRRLYSTEEVEKLELLHRGTKAGHAIGQIAALTVEELRHLLKNELEQELNLDPDTFPVTGDPDQLLDECLMAVDSLDLDALESLFTRAAALLGSAMLIDRLILPLLREIGEEWVQGELRPAHEHMATSVIRNYLGRLLAASRPAAGARRIVVTTPAGQIHELGAMIAAVTAASEGWRVLYLGPNLPADEIAGALLRYGATAVAMSIVYPPDDPELHEEITILRKSIGPKPTIFIGGRITESLATTLEKVNAIHVQDMPNLRQKLARWQS